MTVFDRNIPESSGHPEYASEYHHGDYFDDEAGSFATQIDRQTSDDIDSEFIGRTDKVVVYRISAKRSDNYIFGFGPEYEGANPLHLLHKQEAIIFVGRITQFEGQHLRHVVKPNGLPFASVYLPLVRKEFLRQGIAVSIYKMLTHHYNIVASNEQSKQASFMWKEKLNHVVNHMYSISDNPITFDEVTGDDSKYRSHMISHSDAERHHFVATSKPLERKNA